MPEFRILFVYEKFKEYFFSNLFKKYETFFRWNDILQFKG